MTTPPDDAAPRAVPHPALPDSDAAAVAAARARLTADRRTRHLDQVLLSAEEERGLALLVRAGSGALAAAESAHLSGERRRAVDALLLHNTRLVAHIARSHRWTGLEFDDLVGHGVFGLIRAVERFDPAAGTRFSTYATWWIRQYIRRAAANESRLIREPVHVVERINKVVLTDLALSADGSRPAVDMTARACGLSEQQVRDCRRLAVGVASLDRLVGTTTLAEILHLAAPTGALHGDLTAAEVRAAVAALPTREAEVVSRRFGLDGDPETLEQVGRQLGVTRERIRQIESVALARLRRLLDTEPAASRLPAA